MKLLIWTKLSKKVLTDSHFVEFFMIFASFFGLIANPNQVSVVEGKVLLTQAPSLLEVHSSDRAILEWNSFSIEQGEITRFIQPSQDSSVLNRVTGKEMSQILGRLESNGHVYLVNPNGLVIGPEGKVDAASFIASTLDFKTAEFLSKGDLYLIGNSTQSITHLGSIETSHGPVVLAAHKIEVEGSIKALESTVSLASGHEILLNPNGETLLYIRPDFPSEGVLQNGSIEALKIKIQNSGATALAINLGGTIEAHCVVNEGGEIYLRAGGGDVVLQESAFLRASQGTIVIDETNSLHSSASFDVNGEMGGHIHLFAKEIDLVKGSFDASGQRGGGEILIGKDLNRDIEGRIYANHTQIKSQVSLKADAFQEGNGGTIVAWANDTMKFDADLSAQSFGTTGNGGFAEVSGEKELWISSHPNLSSLGGLMGTLLLDPEGAVTIDHSSSSGPNTYGDSYISAQLATSSLTIDTANATGGGTPTITIDNGVSISWTAATTLTLQAEQGISAYGVVATFSATSGSIAMLTPQPTVSPNTSSSLHFNSTITLETSSGNITLSGNSTTGAGLTLSGSNSISTQTGTISISGVSQSNYGIYFQNNESLSITGNGQLIMAGTGSYGIYFETPTISSASSQNISFTGSSTDGSYGIYFNNLGTASFSTSGSGNMVFEGSVTNTTTASDCIGVGVTNSDTGVSMTASGSGSISITGSCSGTTLNSSGGIALYEQSITVGSGTITFDGSVSATSGSNNYGIGGGLALPDLTSSTTDGSLIVTADASGVLSGSNNIGLSVDPDNSWNLVNFPDGIAFSCFGGSSGTGNDAINGGITNSAAYIYPNNFTVEGTASSGYGFYLVNSSFEANNLVSITALNGNAYTNSSSFFCTDQLTLQTNQGSFTLDIDSDLNAGNTLISTSGNCTINGGGGNPTFYPAGPMSVEAGGALILNGGFYLTYLGPYAFTLQGTSIQMTGDFTAEQPSGSPGNAGNFTMTGPTSVTGSTTITGLGDGGTAACLIFNSSFTSSGGAQTLSIAGDTGSMTFYGNMGTEANPFSTLSFSSSDTTTGIELAGANLYGNSVSFTGLVSLSTGPCSITAETGALTLQSIVGGQNLTLNVPNHNLTLPSPTGSSTNYLGALIINCGDITTLSATTLYVSSVTFNSVVNATGGTSTINTQNGNATFNSTLSGLQNLVFNTGSGAAQFLAGISLGSGSCNVTGTNFTFGETFTSTAGNITFNASQNLTFNDNSSMSTAGAGTINLTSTGGVVSLGKNVTIQTASGNIFIAAGTNFSGAGNTTIETSGASTNITLVADNANSSPPNIGTGGFSFPSGGVFTTNGILSFYSSLPQANSLPSTLNGLSYTQGSYNPLTGVYTTGTNEFVGFWYNVAPFPPDPSYEVIYKAAPNIPPIPASSLQQATNAVTEPVSSTQTSTQSTQTATQNRTTPTPKSACKGTPSVSIRMGR